MYVRDNIWTEILCLVWMSDKYICFNIKMCKGVQGYFLQLNISNVFCGKLKNIIVVKL